MGQIKIKGSDGTEYVIQKNDTSKQVETITKVGAGAGAGAVEHIDNIDKTALTKLLAGVDSGDVAAWDLKKLVEKAGTFSMQAGGDKTVVIEKANTGAAKLEGLSDALAQLTTDIANVKKDLAKTPTPTGTDLTKLQTQLTNLEFAEKAAKSQLESVYNTLQAASSDANFPDEVRAKMKSVAASHKFDAPKSPEMSGGKATMSSGGAAQAGTASGAQGAAQQPGAGAGKAAMPGEGKAFNLDNYLQNTLQQDQNMAGSNAIMTTQAQQKKMMMLFMYFAMMAATGDIGAMASFMQFITVIITKDKSQQNIQMANKMIELQDNARKANQLLLDTPSYDPNNQQVSADFSKVMEKVKAEQGSIATSQKLISQMMEEFAQVSESLNNTLKGLLDARGRVMSTMSRMS